ncbi:MAG: 6-aminohexanoate hydrolase, partial [Planctomycetota bacterium]
MRPHFLLLLLLSVVVPNGLTRAESPSVSNAGLPRATPESQGVDSSNVLEFIEAADQKVDSMHSF